MKLTITKEFGWDCAHCLREGNEDQSVQIFGKCNNLHGHTYKMFVTVSGINSIEHGMVVNFTELKKIVNKNVVDRFDHTFLNNDELYKEGRLTTCENQVYDIWNLLEKPLSEINVQLEEIKLYETPTSFATLTK